MPIEEIKQQEDGANNVTNDNQITQLKPYQIFKKAHSHERIISLYYDAVKELFYSTSKDNFINEYEFMIKDDIIS